MEKVTNYQQLNREIGARFKPGLKTNCSLSAGELNQLIDEGALYSMSGGQNLFLFERVFAEAAEFFRVYYYLLDEREPVFDFPNSCICENVFREGADLMPAPWFERKGFVKAFERQRMLFMPQVAADSSLSEKAAVSSAGEKSRTPSPQEVLDLFTESFDPRTAYLPSLFELEQELSEGQIFWSYEDSVLVGAAEVVKRKGYNELRHIAVRRSTQGRAKASAILNDVISVYAIPKLLVWVRKDNVPALKLYTKAGFTADKYTSAVWTTLVSKGTGFR